MPGELYDVQPVTVLVQFKAVHKDFADLIQILLEPYSLAIAVVRTHSVERLALCLASMLDTLRAARSSQCLRCRKSCRSAILATPVHASQSFDCFRI